MNIGVLGTGPVGQAFAARLTELGHDVSIGTRHPDTKLARSGPGPFGTPPFRQWREAHPTVELGTFARAAAFGEIVVNATLGSASLEALQAAGEKALASKGLVQQ